MASMTRNKIYNWDRKKNWVSTKEVSWKYWYSI